MSELKSYGARFWEDNYASGGTSGAGSYGAVAEFKARVLNNFVAAHGVSSVIEFGCGDGNQLSLAVYPEYTGFDVSQTAIEMCSLRFAHDATKEFRHISEYAGDRADLALSLDVIYHIIEQEVYENYMRRLFAAGARYVIVYAVDRDIHPEDRQPHMYHRQFSTWVAANAPEFKLVDTVVNECGYMTNFYIYARCV